MTLLSQPASEICAILRGVVVTQPRVGVIVVMLLAGFCRQTVQAGNLGEDKAVKLPIVDGDDIAFRHLTIRDGLSHSIVNRIVQDDQGFMWFGAQAGLNRYDGYRFKVYKQDQARQNSLSGAYIRALFKDRVGHIWIGVDQFLDEFDPVTETFKHYRTDSEVVHISQDHAGILWVSTSNGLLRLEPLSGRITAYRHNTRDPESLSSSEVSYSLEDSAGTFWIATARGIDAFDKASGKVRIHVPILQPHAVLLHEDRLGVLWVAYPNGSGLAVLNRKTNTLTRYQLYDREPPSTAVAGVATIFEDRDGTLWFGTHGNGLLRLGPERQKFVRYSNNPSNPGSLSQNTQLAVFEDREGTIWVAASGSGIDQFARKPLPFERFQHQPGNPNSLDRTKVNSVYEDAGGILWVGTEGGLNRIDRKTGKYKLYRDGDQNNVVTVTGDGSGNLLTGSFGSGLKRFHKTTGKFKVHLHNPADSGSLSNNIVVRIFRDHAGKIWAGTADGLDRFDPETNTFTTYQVDPERPGRQSYVCITEDQQGFLWLGTQNSGLQSFNPATGAFSVYEHQPDVARSLSNDRVLSLLFDHAGILWVGTQNGLNRFDPRTHSFTTFFERDGLPAASIYGILENHTGDLWLSTNGGISKFNPLRNTFTNYTAADGLPGDEFGLFGACFHSPSGEMFFGGPSGITAFFPDHIVESVAAPPMVLTDFRLFANPVSIGGNSPLQRSISYTDSIRLSAGQNIFSLEFSALSYGNPATNRYRYKLDPLETHWNETTGNNRAVTYTTLPPGDYLFRAQGAANRGPWNEAGIALHVKVSPPWWATWWFESIAAAAILILLAMLYRLRLRQIAHQFDLRLDDRVAERTRIARDLHDNLLQGFHGLMMRFQLVQKMLPERPAEAEQALNIAMERAARAITEGRDAVQALRNHTPDSADLVPALKELGEEMTALYAASGNGRTPGMFRLLVGGRLEALHPILQDELYGIAREAVGNAFRHAQAKTIEVDVRFEPRTLRLRVRDDGIGMEAGIRQAGRAGHWGLPCMRERAKNIGARFELWSETGTGTEIAVSLRASIAYQNGSGPGGRRRKL